ncbi:MAG: type II toxin-antitoxin system Phd/YefM family antitoxin [Anaerolineae bacterium]
MSINIVPISDLRRQAKKVIDGLRDGDQVAYITQHGRPTAVLVDYEQYEALIAQLNELRQSQPAYAIAEEKGAFSALADMAQDLGVDDLSEQHDHYLYGVEKQ